MQKSFCVTEFCVTELIIIFETSCPTQLNVKYHKWEPSQRLRNTDIENGSETRIVMKTVFTVDGCFLLHIVYISLHD
jgi:hypothetical protein